MHLDQFLPQIIGGILIGLSAAVLLLFNGQIAGISGIYGRLVQFEYSMRHWRIAFLIGLLLPTFFLLFNDSEPTKTVNVGTLAVAGFLVGIGTSISNGCTSGHGICGMANLSRRSFFATILFMTSAFITVFIIRHILRMS